MNTPHTTRVPAHITLFHGFGAMAYGVKENGFSVFLLLFYNQVVGMPASMVSLALMIAMLIDAFADPVIGHLSDRTHSRWGRRLPWLYLAAVPLAAAWMLLWHPPGLSGWQAFAYLVATAILVRTLVSACEVPSIAIVPELSADYDARTRLVRARLLFAWAGGLLMLFLAYDVFLTTDDAGKVGQLQASGYWHFGLAGAVLMATSVLVSAAGQHRLLAHLPARRPAPTTLSHAFREIRETISHPAYLVLISTIVFAEVSTQITFVLSNYLYIFVWRFSEDAFRLYPLVLMASVVAAFFLVAITHRRWGKRETVLGAVGVGTLFWTMPFVLMLAGAWPVTGGTASTGAVFACFLIANTAAVTVQISLVSMIADVVEASEVQTGRRSEGLLYAGNLFTRKCATGVGILLAGIIIDTAGLPENATPGQVAQPVIDMVAGGYVIAILVMALGVIWRVRHFPINRADHEARLVQLAVTSTRHTDERAGNPH